MLIGRRNKLINMTSNAHANCVVCSSANENGLGLSFKTLPNGRVEAVFDCNRIYEGYHNVLHGGIISALLDGAMTNCMFSHGIHAVTAELNVKFHFPVACSQPVRITAWISRSTAKLYLMQAEILQNDRIMATANGKFVRIMEPPDQESHALETATC